MWGAWCSCTICTMVNSPLDGGDECRRFEKPDTEDEIKQRERV